MNIENLYTSHNLAIMIKSQAKVRKVSIKDMLIACNLGSNTMSALYHGKSIAFDSLAKIADYLDVSVDYLLGRTTDTSPAVIPYNGVSKSSIDLPLDITTDDMELINFILSKYK